jgi:exopolysaccharide production protein ExoZ
VLPWPTENTSSVTVTFRFEAKLRGLFAIDSDRFVALEGLRGIAAFLVVIQHYATLMAERVTSGSGLDFVVRLTDRVGAVGVQLFFIISGFIIYAALDRRSGSYIEFIKRRMRRIFPLAWVIFSIVLASKFANESDLIVDPVTGNQALDILCNYLLIPGIHPADPIYDVMWTLSYEMLFYFSFPLLLLLVKHFALSMMGRNIFWIILSVLIVVAIPRLAAIAFFFCGVVAFELQKYMQGRTASLAKIGAIASWALPLVIIYFALIDGKFMDQPFELGKYTYPLNRIPLFGAIGIITMIAVAHQSGVLAKALSVLPLRIMGNISYSLYITHALVMQVTLVVASYFMVPGVVSVSSYAALFIAASIICIIAACVSFCLIERPLSLDGKWPWGIWMAKPNGYPA